MDQASPFAYFNRKKAATHSVPLSDQHRLIQSVPEIDTNVISINFKNLKQAEENLQMGDPIFCESCKSCLSNFSKILPKAEYETKFSKKADSNNKEEEKVEVQNEISSEILDISKMKDHEKVWICEFCGVHNLVTIESEEIPNKNDVVYMLQSLSQSKLNTTSGLDDSVIFCIDNSGSMSVTHEVQGKHDLKHGLSEEEYEMLKQFIEYGAEQLLPGQKKNTTYISRKQCVMAAIESQLLELKKEHPHKKVGIVTFNDEVCVIGDAQQDPEIIAGDKLNKFDIIQQIAKDKTKTLLSKTVNESADKIIERFKKLEEKGRTALGPGLLVALTMAAQGKKGSKVIICTDGLANIGLGEMDTPNGIEKASAFYAECAQFAKESGIAVSVISIKGEGCKLDIIGKLAGETSGDLTRVDPAEITNNFANILKDEVLGTGVKINLRLHKAFKFRNETAESLKENDSLLEKDIGNVTQATTLTFEYENRSDEELVQLKINPDQIKSVPFQVQITYTAKSGNKLLRVITQRQDVTENLEMAEEQANVRLLACRALQRQAQLAERGDYMASELESSNWNDYLGNRVLSHNKDKDAGQVYSKFNQKKSKVSSAVNNRIARTYTEQTKDNSILSSAPIIHNDSRKQYLTPISKTYSSNSSHYNAPKKSEPKKMVAGNFNKLTIVHNTNQKDCKIEKKKMEEIPVQEEVEDDEDAEYEAIHKAKAINEDF